MKKKLEFNYTTFDEILDILNGNDPNYKLILTDYRGNENVIRGITWYYIKQKSNGVIFRLKTEFQFEDISSPTSRRKIILYSLTVLNFINTFIYTVQNKNVRELLILCKWIINIIIIYLISILILMGLDRILLIKIVRFNLTKSFLFFQYPFLLLVWGIGISFLKSKPNPFVENELKF